MIRSLRPQILSTGSNPGERTAGLFRLKPRGRITTKFLLALAIGATSAGAADAQARRPLGGGSPCIAGDPVRGSCQSSPLYNAPPGTPNLIQQAPDTSARRTFGTSPRPRIESREGVPQR